MKTFVPTNMAGEFVIYLLLFSILCVKGHIVKTNSGQVEGVKVKSILKNEEYYSFMGIPYARPPVGKLRFMAPEPHPGWTETLNAKKEKKHCAQFNFPMRHIDNYGFCGDEDCLHLSIHTPDPNKDANLPVIVFLYNELFKVSYNASREFGPDFFMKEDVLIVTVHHRIGSLGFLGFDDDLLPGNNGLRDVILALKWLKENVGNFGGNPSRITLMGNHDGAGLVDVLLHSSKAKGLFSKAILQSGTSWTSLYFGQKPNRERAIEFSKVLEQDATSSSFLLKRLVDIDAKKLTESENYSVHADEARAIQRGIIAFGPTIEHDHPDAVITKLPENNPLDIDIPIMIGYNSREAIEMCDRYLQRPQFLTFADRDFLVLLPIRTKYHFEIHDDVYQNVIDDIKQFYFDEGYVKISKPGEYITYLGDIMSFYSIDYTVRKYTNESKSDVYYYMFDYSGELNLRKKYTLENSVTMDGTWGAALGDELCYLFVCNKIRKVYKKLLEDEDSEEIKVIRNMVRMWANFAKSGNPTPPGGDFTWHPATKENKECLVISDELEMKTKLHDENVNFWDEFIEKYRNLAIDGVVKDKIKDEL